MSPSSTLFIQHGHAGIYYSTTVIVHAPGADQYSRWDEASRMKVGSGAVKQYVDRAQTERDLTAIYAYHAMRGAACNSNFAFNRDTDDLSKLNCSQLVWAAYKLKTGVDLDSNGGFGVYPYDIKNSRLTHTYQTL